MPAPDRDIGMQIPPLWGWQTWLSLSATLVLLLYLATRIDFGLVWRDMAACNKGYVVLGFLAHYATYPVRGLRWQRALGSKTKTTGWQKFGIIVFFYNAVDNVVPAKLGDLYAAHLARLNFRIRRSSALGSIVFLRMIDAWIVLMLAAISSWFVFAARLPNNVVWVLGGGLLLAMAITGGLAVFAFVRSSAWTWVPAAVSEMIEAFRGTMWPARGDRIPIGGFTAAIWTLESMWMLCLVTAFGWNLSLAEVLFVTQIPLLASAFPLTPSGAGAVEITLYSCLRLIGVPHDLAISITVLNRLVDYWLHIGLGILLWGFRRHVGIYTWRERDSTWFENEQAERLPL
jgi:uncharacterized protein (TIRG00374 family)